MKIPIIGFAGFSGSGKTTLIEKLIPILREKGLRLAVIKHDGHRVDIDRPGKDSARFSAAGAEMVVLTSKEKTAVIEQRTLSLEDSLQFIHDVDLVLVEGYKNADITQIGVARQCSGKGFPSEPNSFWRIVTDMEISNVAVPVYASSDILSLADDIVNHRDTFTYFHAK